MVRHDLKEELNIALQEIGAINPWYDKSVQSYVFEHPAYPLVSYDGQTLEEVVNGYPFALQDFIEERLRNNVSEADEKITSGRGGKRPGSGRPKKDYPIMRICLPADLGNWLKDPENQQKAIRLMTSLP